MNSKRTELCQEVAQSARIMPNEVKVTSLNPPPLLCGHVKKITEFSSKLGWRNFLQPVYKNDMCPFFLITYEMHMSF